MTVAASHVAAELGAYIRQTQESKGQQVTSLKQASLPAGGRGGPWRLAPGRGGSPDAWDEEASITCARVAWQWRSWVYFSCATSTALNVFATLARLAVHQAQFEASAVCGPRSEEGTANGLPPPLPLPACRATC